MPLYDNKLTGVYIITCKANGRRYVGSCWSKNGVGSRWWRHVRDLKLQIHHNVHLQRCWDKYGEDQFEFKLVAHLKGRKHCLHQEQLLIDGLDNLMNLGPAEGGAWPGYKHTEETKAKLSKRARERLNSKAWKDFQKISKEIKSIKWTCPHCGTEGTSLCTAKRWHFDRCRVKTGEEYVPTAKIKAQMERINRKDYTCTYCGMTGLTKGHFVRWHNDNCKQNPESPRYEGKV